jgi:hypothetical protein
MEIKSIIYGLGGYDKAKENDNIAEVIYYTDVELLELEKEKQKSSEKAALLEKLGITESEAKLLLS